MLILFSVSLLTCQNLQFKGHIRVLFLQDHSLVFQTEADFFQDSINYVHFSLVPTDLTFSSKTLLLNKIIRDFRMQLFQDF